MELYRYRHEGDASVSQPALDTGYPGFLGESSDFLTLPIACVEL